MAKSDDDFLLSDAIPIDQLGDDDNLLADAIPIDQLSDDEPAKGGGGKDEGIDLADDEDAPKQEIRTFERKKTDDEDSRYARPVNTTRQGASRIKTFVAKLRLDAIEHMDHQVNEWLDAHPDYEIKSAVSVVGELTGKIKEPALFMTVFY